MKIFSFHRRTPEVFILTKTCFKSRNIVKEKKVNPIQHSGETPKVSMKQNMPMIVLLQLSYAYTSLSKYTVRSLHMNTQGSKNLHITNKLHISELKLLQIPRKLIKLGRGRKTWRQKIAVCSLFYMIYAIFFRFMDYVCIISGQ